MTNSTAIEHPSEPNYLDLFSGSNQGVDPRNGFSGDELPIQFPGINLPCRLCRNDYALAA